MPMVSNFLARIRLYALPTTVCFLVIAVAFGCASERSRWTDGAGGIWQAIDEEIERFQVTERLPRLSVAVLKGGEVAFAQGYGWADIDRQTRVSRRTMFPIGSM